MGYVSSFSLLKSAGVLACCLAPASAGQHAHRSPLPTPPPPLPQLDRYVKLENRSGIRNLNESRAK